MLIGSRSLALRLGSAFRRSPIDFDWASTKAEFDQWMERESHKVQPTKVYELPEYSKWICEGNTNCEFEIVKEGSSSELLTKLVESDPDTIETQFGLIPSLNLLFAIKQSHRFKKFNHDPRPWFKHCQDWHLMKRCGAEIKPEHEAFLKLREAESYANQKHPKLNVSKSDFFKDDGIQYIWSHDDLHEAVKVNDTVAYTHYLQDNEPVKCSKQKFFAVSEHIRLSGGAEEGMTLALERSLIPSPGAWTPDYAFHFAMGKVCSSITSGFFRLWCFEALPEILKLYNETSKDYYGKFQRALADGKVRPHDPNSQSY